MPENETTSFWFKIGIYVLGCVLGLGAKLASMRRQRVLTMTDAIIEFAIAAAASFVVWAFCHYKMKEDDLAIIASVIVGRYGDNIIMVACNKVEHWIKKLGEK